jgi:hypothetical protein
MRRLAAACLLALLAACASSSNVSGDRRTVGSVTVTFTVVPSAAKIGQSVRLTLRLVNDSGVATKLVFPSGKKYDFWITSGRREIWRWSAGKFFTQEVTTQEIGGQTGTALSESWTAAQSGHFVAHGHLYARGYEGDMNGTLDVS